MFFASKFCTHALQNGLKALITNTTSNVNRCIHILTKSSLHRSNFIINQQITVKQENFLSPVTSLVNQVVGFKVRGRIKRRCKDCLLVVRQERSYIICPTHPRHKQMAMKKRDYKSWILTHATQSKVRPY